MIDVNTKLQDFYNRGYTDAINECSTFLNAIEDKFGTMQLGERLTLAKFIAAMNIEINKFSKGLKDVKR